LLLILIVLRATGRTRTTKSARCTAGATKTAIAAKASRATKTAEPTATESSAAKTVAKATTSIRTGSLLLLSALLTAALLPLQANRVLQHGRQFFGHGVLQRENAQFVDRCTIGHVDLFQQCVHFLQIARTSLHNQRIAAEV